MLTVVPAAGDADEPRRDGGPALIDELVREGARRMLAEAFQAEVDDYIARHLAERDEHGRRLVVRNGSHQPREVLTSAGAVEVRAPGSTTAASTRTPGNVIGFSSAILPAWCRKTPKITDDLDELLAFYDDPAEHWIHLRTPSPIVSTFATVRHRTKITRGPGSRAAGLAMAFTLIEAAQDRWRAVDGPHLVALVRAGARFESGKLVERPDDQPQPEAA